ncbi:MAG TPA: hypothetical protein PKX31_13950, partial [Chitinophagaceae bacterium]|nr:hypothetical protein [Chitinophagaceae bacterium]
PLHPHTPSIRTRAPIAINATFLVPFIVVNFLVVVKIVNSKVHQRNFSVEIVLISAKPQFSNAAAWFWRQNAKYFPCHLRKSYSPSS